MSIPFYVSFLSGPGDFYSNVKGLNYFEDAGMLLNSDRRTHGSVWIPVVFREGFCCSF